MEVKKTLPWKLVEARGSHVEVEFTSAEAEIGSMEARGRWWQLSSNFMEVLSSRFHGSAVTGSVDFHGSGLRFRGSDNRFHGSWWKLMEVLTANIHGSMSRTLPSTST